MAKDREHIVTILNRLGTTSADATTAYNELLEFLSLQGFADVGAALISRMAATSTFPASAVRSTVLAQTQNLNYSGKSHHEAS